MLSPPGSSTPELVSGALKTSFGLVWSSFVIFWQGVVILWRDAILPWVRCSSTAALFCRDFGNFYVLEDNVRNTPQIVSFYQNICPSIKEVHPLSPNGPENEVFVFERIDIKKLDNVINKLLKKYSLKANELIIIVRNQSELSELRISSSKISNLSSKLSFDFVDVNKVRVINVETVKGLESKAVLIWSDYKAFSETEKYIAMSRARSLLAFVELNSK